MSAKISYNEPRYDNLKLPHVIALDTYLAQKYITEKRHIIGNVLNIKTKYKNCITNNDIEESSEILKDINSKLDSEFYRTFDSKTFSNTLNYIYHYVKVGIYVRIVNSVWCNLYLYLIILLTMMALCLIMAMILNLKSHHLKMVL